MPVTTCIKPGQRPKTEGNLNSQSLTRPKALQAFKGNVGLYIVTLIILLVFLGLALYSGYTLLVQNELQKALNHSALVGASAFYDDADWQQLNPPIDADNESTARSALRRTFARYVAASPLLSNLDTKINRLNTFAPGITPGITSGNSWIRAEGSSSIELSFLRLAGLSNITIASEASAFYTRPKVNRDLAILYTQDGPEPEATIVENSYGPTKPVPLSPGATWQVPSPCRATAINPSQQWEFDLPLTDRPGADLRILTNLDKGYYVLACSSSSCWDIGLAAKMMGTRKMRVVTRGSQQNAILYGSSIIDLAALGPKGYDKNVNKARFIKILDDGMSDVFLGAQRLVEACPTPLIITDIQVLHGSSLCFPGSAQCRIPTP